MKLEEIRIGSQTWQTKNLNVTKFRNGDLIPEVKSNDEWEFYINEGKPARCFFKNDELNYGIYGHIYNIHAVKDKRGLAPLNFRIPNKEDWEKLNFHLERDYFSGDSQIASFFPHSGGCRHNDGEFAGWAEISQLWCSTPKYLFQCFYEPSTKKLQLSEIKPDFFYGIAFAVRCVSE
jgi:uncharacterized protein (TIGR02145 family)